MTFDPSKPVQTRDGRKARIICTDLKGDHPITGTIDFGTYELVTFHYASGEEASKAPAHTLINTPSIPKGLRGLDKYAQACEGSFLTIEEIAGYLDKEDLVVVSRRASKEMICAMDNIYNNGVNEMCEYYDAAIATWEESE